MRINRPHRAPPCRLANRLTIQSHTVTTDHCVASWRGATTGRRRSRYPGGFRRWWTPPANNRSSPLLELGFSRVRALCAHTRRPRHGTCAGAFDRHPARSILWRGGVGPRPAHHFFYVQSAPTYAYVNPAGCTSLFSAFFPDHSRTGKVLDVPFLPRGLRRAPAPDVAPR